MRNLDKLIQLIKHFEGFSARAYICPAGYLTIGYGTVIDSASEQYLKSKVITEQEGKELILKDLEVFMRQTDALIKVKLNDDQYAAVLDFVYNCGAGNFKSSTLLKKINKNPLDATISAEFQKWTRANGKVLKGLVRRRNAEALLYFSNPNYLKV